MYRFLFILASLVAMPMANAAPKTGMEPHTAAAVLAADKAWSEAEERGDAAYVDWLLLPGYVSIGHDGTPHTRLAIVEGARKRAQGDVGDRASKIVAWRLAHPYRSEVKLFGDTAVVSFLSTKAGSGEPVNSSDIFVYRGGHWHAIYSQHSDAGS
ncbi:hypothetical protein ACVWZA_004330 [Sphingomonas sp. UYAg733]